MNVLTIPRSVIALEYKALRFPYQLLETKVVAARFPEDSGLRLGYERLLGSLDSKAGALLGDKDLTDRGRALSRRADVIEKAVSLEAKAEQRKREADAQLRSSTEKAQSERAQARKTEQQELQQAELDKQKAKAEAERKAAERKQADRKAVAAKTRAKLDAEKKRADAQQARIDQQTAARTAAPKAELSDAVAGSAKAAERRADAEELARLAEQEKQSRQSTSAS